MIKKFIQRLLGKAGEAAPAADATAAVPAIPLGRRVEIGVADHRIDPSLLDEYACVSCAR